jgi:hypothetical protein
MLNHSQSLKSRNLKSHFDQRKSVKVIF